MDYDYLKYKKILIVDDEADLREMVTSILEGRLRKFAQASVHASQRSTMRQPQQLSVSSTADR